MPYNTLSDSINWDWHYAAFDEFTNSEANSCGNFTTRSARLDFNFEFRKVA